MSHSQFESAVKVIPYPQQTVYSQLADLRHLSGLRDKLSDPALAQQLTERVPNVQPEELQRQLQDMELDADSVTVASPVGKVTLRIIDREEPKCIKFEAEGSPLPFNVWIQLLPVGDDSCKMRVTLRAEVNVFMKAMVSKPLQQAVDGLADLLGKDTLPVNSYHHQAIHTLAPGLAAMAAAPDGIIEAVYEPGKRFVWAVQWHPECLRGPDGLALLEAFADRCR